ncbi:MAG: class II fructose-bisphosphate aldolase [Sedimentisphaerales bacterium]|nr:class II fructose-bisphosphate aldolase [Sedimentisphaerales bacterium]
MLVSTLSLLRTAAEAGYAIGAFNVYNLEAARAVVAASEANRSPAILQILPRAFELGGAPLVKLCLAAARDSSVPISVHLDHSRSPDDIKAVLSAGLSSVMADGSHLSYHDNVAFTQAMADIVHKQGAVIEGELGQLTGTEYVLPVSEYEESLTDPDQASDFVAKTGIDALAVCIGNVHGRYPKEPRLDFDRLAAIRSAVAVPLVLHGASGLNESSVRRSIQLGISKFNVNTELRQAYLDALRESLHSSPSADLPDLMQEAVACMSKVVSMKLHLFGSVGKAGILTT